MDYDNDPEAFFARRRAAASYYRAHGTSYAEACRVFNLPSFDVNAARVSPLDRAVLWLDDHYDLVYLVMVFLIMVGAALVLKLIFP